MKDIRRRMSKPTAQSEPIVSTIAPVFGRANAWSVTPSVTPTDAGRQRWRSADQGDGGRASEEETAALPLPPSAGPPIRPLAGLPSEMRRVKRRFNTVLLRDQGEREQEQESGVECAVVRRKEERVEGS